MSARGYFAERARLSGEGRACPRDMTCQRPINHKGKCDASDPPMTARKPSAAPVADLSAYQWLTTAPNPCSRPTGYDQGQRGWSTHAVLATSDAKFSELRTVASLCGLVPAHGWGMDMFIERECRRCLRKLGFACLTCRGSGYRRTSVTHYEDCPDCKGTGKTPAGREAARRARD